MKTLMIDMDNVITDGNVLQIISDEIGRDIEIGDTFYFTILDRTITYEVDQIRIVEPNDMSLIEIEEGKDYCTLLTCTPYGLNTQRLLIRGQQIDTSQKRNLYVVNEAYRVEPLIVMPIVALPIIFVLLIYVMVVPVKKESLGEDLL
jgi:sortase A